MSKFFRPGKPDGSSNNDKRGDGKPFKKQFGRRGDKPVSSRKEFDSWKKRGDSDAPQASDKPAEKPYGDRPFKKSFDKPYGKRNFKRDDTQQGDYKPKSDKPFSERKQSDHWKKRISPETSEDFGQSTDKSKTAAYGRPYNPKKKFAKPYGKKRFTKGSFGQQAEKTDSDLIRLNKYLANAGVSSRREADRLIESGVVTVNGKVITELGYKISPGDEVKFGGAILRKEKTVYILLNKPKDYITTSKDPQERKTVMHLIEGACKERVYPVGRLDRMTTGLLLFTNDGEMAKRLTHPSHGAKKMYHVTLDQNLSLADMKRIEEGVELEDGKAQVDAIEFVEGAGRKEIGIELHSGRNRIVRRIFESLGYKVVKLDRVIFAGLTKKDLQRGYWRKLSEKEVGMLMMRN